MTPFTIFLIAVVFSFRFRIQEIMHDETFGNFAACARQNTLTGL